MYNKPHKNEAYMGSTLCECCPHCSYYDQPPAQQYFSTAASGADSVSTFVTFEDKVGLLLGREESRIEQHRRLHGMTQN